MQPDQRIVKTILGLSRCRLGQFFYRGGYAELAPNLYRFETAGTDMLLSFFTREQQYKHRLLTIRRSTLRIKGLGYIHLDTEIEGKKKLDPADYESYNNSVTIPFSHYQDEHAAEVLKVLGVSYTVGATEIQHAIAICFASGDTLLIEQNDAPAGFTVRFNPPQWMAYLLINPL